MCDCGGSCHRLNLSSFGIKVYKLSLSLCVWDVDEMLFLNAAAPHTDKEVFVSVLNRMNKSLPLNLAARDFEHPSCYC